MNDSPSLKSEWVELINSFSEESSTLDILSACINTFGDGGIGLSFYDWGQIVCKCIEQKTILSEPNVLYLSRYNANPILKIYKEWFSNMKVSNRMGQKAPHKYILLISIFELIGSGVITSNQFGSTYEIENRFLDNWVNYIPPDSPFKPNYTLPFWHMKSEPFWVLYDKNGNRINKQETKAIVTVSTQRRELTAELVEGLYVRVKDEGIRNYLISHLIKCVKNEF